MTDVTARLSDEARAERCVSSLCIASLRQELRDVGYFDAASAVTTPADDSAIIASVAPGVSRAQRLHTLLGSVLQQIKRGELGPEMTAKHVRGIEALLAALDPAAEPSQNREAL
jgi:hypothetical protein